MTEQALANLRISLDHLGPNVWLTLDEVAVERHFGYGPDARQAAKAFAKENGCVCLGEAHGVKFGRAYNKKGGNA